MTEKNSTKPPAASSPGRPASWWVPAVVVLTLLLLARAAWQTGDTRAALVTAVQVVGVSVVVRFALRRAEASLREGERRWRGTPSSGTSPDRRRTRSHG